MSETIQIPEPSRRAVNRGLPRWTIVVAALVAAAAGAGATTLVQKSHAVTLVALAPEQVSRVEGWHDGGDQGRRRRNLRQ